MVIYSRVTSFPKLFKKSGFGGGLTNFDVYFSSRLAQH